MKAASFLVLAFCVVCSAAAAETDTKRGGAAHSPPVSATPPPAERAGPATPVPTADNGAADVAHAVPDPYSLNILIRSTMIAINQANKTGNYSVLRDLGSPNFQTANNSAKLTEIFGALRNSNLDLSPVFFFNPELFQKPAIDANGLLRLTGFFATQPQQLQFDLAYEFVQGEWRLFGVGVWTRPSPGLNVHETPSAKPQAPAE